MMNTDAKEQSRLRVAELVRRFARNQSDYLRPSYNETQARTDFITPLLEAYGWDVHNDSGQPLSLREVIEEATVGVGEERLSKKPDYELRLARQRKLFVEAKKPSVHIDRDRAPAFQTRRYGYSASLPISVLTNFHQLAIYDCRPIPSDSDDPRVARLLLVDYEEFETRFDELWGYFSRDVVYSGDFDNRFAVGFTGHGSEQFDDYFLRQVRSWRHRLAVDIHSNTPSLTPQELTYAVQLFLTRIVFLRICEDRELENYETLKGLSSPGTFDALMTLLHRADEFYDSGLFRLLDDKPLGIRISDVTLHAIISELYYPQSPYTFAVVETEVLGEIYEQFLGEIIRVSANGVEIVHKPEVRESGGVVPTPRFVVDSIVQRTLGPAVEGKSPNDLCHFTVADICCGSGVFLLSAYEFLLDHYLSWYQANDLPSHLGRTVYEVAAGQYRLTLEERRRILLVHLRGVDIDANAVEVARFSLLLKLIENESGNALRDYVQTNRTPALPSLDEICRSGNSLVSEPEWVAAMAGFPDDARDEINPFDWATEFALDMRRDGFDLIVGNPPYIRIQNMTEYSPEEVSYYQTAGSPYLTARENNFDKYALFVERSLTLARPDGRVGLIVPHKFMSIQSGKALRRLIGHHVEQIVHFGTQQVFGPNTSNYTCILILSHQDHQDVRFERIESLERWRYDGQAIFATVPSAELTDAPWQFANPETASLFSRIRSSFPSTLESVAEIFVGVQTSADEVYIVQATRESQHSITTQWNGRDWEIERGVLRPCLHDVALNAYERPMPNKWMIFPYHLIPSSRGTKARLIQPAEFQRSYPGCFEYLTARRSELDKRNVTGGTAAERQWYQFGRSQSLVKFDTEKIILPILSLEPRYAFDDTNIIVTGGGNGPYYMIRPKPNADVTNHYLLAVLNHPLSEAFIRKNTSVFRGGYYSHGKQFIQSLPIPIASQTQREEIEQLVRSLIQTLEEVKVMRVRHQRTVRERQAHAQRVAIEARVSALFALTSAEVEIARSVPIPQ